MPSSNNRFATNVSTERLLKIGDFARVGEVTVKTLHYYDRVNLLKPAYVDESNGYRFYDVAQLVRLHRILALKELGLALEQIGLLLDDEVPTEQIRGMLRLRQAELNEEVRKAAAQLARVEFRLHMIEAETDFPPLDVVIKQLPPMRFLTKYSPIWRTETDGMREMARVAQSVNRAITTGQIHFTGVSIDVFHGETVLPLESTELAPRQHEILLGVAEDQQTITLDEVDHWTIKEEPAVAAATLMVMGDKGGLRAYEKVALLRRWAVAQGYSPGGLVRYFHHRGPLQTLNREEFILEAQLPLLDDDVSPGRTMIDV